MIHSKGTEAGILLRSLFGGQDDQFDSRSINPMELYHNPVLLWTTGREDKRRARGRNFEPPSMLERRNWVQGRKFFTPDGSSARR